MNILGSILGLDALAVARRKLKTEEDAARKEKERRYRDRLDETPTHTGGVSDSFKPRKREHHRGIEVRKDDRDRRRHSDRSDGRDRSERRHRSRSSDNSRRSHRYDGDSSRSSRHDKSWDGSRKSSRSDWSQRSDRSGFSVRSDRSYRKDIRTPRSVRAYDTPSNSHWEEDGDNLRKESKFARWKFGCLSGGYFERSREKTMYWDT